MDQASRVRSHYNKRAKIATYENREDSPIIRLRHMNNFIKSVLISTYVHPEDNVFDLCCGRGGDLQKFEKANVAFLFGVDISEEAINEARKRYESMSMPFNATFLVEDCCVVDLEKKHLFPDDIYFDIVNCQFALHYSFENEAKARMFLRNAAVRLKEGGKFISTIPDSSVLLSHREKSFGNDIYTVTFENKPTKSGFGYRYKFHLVDAIDELDEYVVPSDLLKKLALEEGLHIVEEIPFHEYFKKNAEKYDSLLKKMKVYDEQGNFSDGQWEAVGLYKVFVFEKRSTHVSTSNTSSINFINHVRSLLSDIKTINPEATFQIQN